MRLQRPILILEPLSDVVGQFYGIIWKLPGGEKLLGEAPQAADNGGVEAALRCHRNRLVLLPVPQHGGKLRALHSAPVESQ